MGDPRAAGCAEEPKVAGESRDAKAGETQASLVLRPVWGEGESRVAREPRAAEGDGETRAVRESKATGKSGSPSVSKSTWKYSIYFKTGIHC